VQRQRKLTLPLHSPLQGQSLVRAVRAGQHISLDLAQQVLQGDFRWRLQQVQRRRRVLARHPFRVSVCTSPVTTA